MTREEAKKQILGVFLHELSNDDETLFGPGGMEGEPDHRAFDGARKELIAEFTRRVDGGKSTRLSRALKGML